MIQIQPAIGTESKAEDCPKPGEFAATLVNGLLHSFIWAEYPAEKRELR